MTDNTKMREAMIDQDGAVWEKIGGAWSLYKPAQSVPVVEEPVAWVNINKHGDITRTVRRRDNWCKTPVFVKPTTSIPATELARLREEAGMVDELRKRAERMQKALSDIAEWTDRYTTPGHPVSTIASAAIAQGKGE
jgi:hypothetical protein